MPPDSMIDAARERLAPLLLDREAVWSGQVDRVLGPAAAQGLINSPPVQQQVAGLIRDEMRVRGVLCAEAAVDALESEDAELAGASQGELATVAEMLLTECSEGLIRMCDGFAALGHGAGMPTIEQCRSEGLRAIAEHLDATFAGSVGQ